jgi:hypothetical protein
VRLIDNDIFADGERTASDKKFRPLSSEFGKISQQLEFFLKYMHQFISGGGIVFGDKFPNPD